MGSGGPQRWDWRSLEVVERELEACNAFLDSDEAETEGRRLRDAKVGVRGRWGSRCGTIMGNRQRGGERVRPAMWQLIAGRWGVGMS